MKSLDWLKGLFTLCLALSLSGCATTGDVLYIDKDIRRLDTQSNRIQKETELHKKEVDSLKKEVDSLKKEVDSLKKEPGTLKREIDLMKNELATFRTGTEKEIKSLQAENQRLRADLLLRLETLQTETRTLATAFEEYKEFLRNLSKDTARSKENTDVRLKVVEERGKSYDEKTRTFDEKNKGLEEKIRTFDEKNKGLDAKTRFLETRNQGLEERNRILEERSKALESRFKELEAKLTLKTVEVEKTTPAKESPPPVVGEAKGAPTAAGNLYKDAYETFQKGDMEGARRKFEAFLKQYPNMELSDNAQFWIGETYYQKKDFEKAILEYEKAIVKYPEGDKIPSALLKQGLAFQELGDKTNARNLLRRVAERYPQTEQAEVARKRLEGLK